MVDTSPYTIPFRIQAAAWLYESDRSNKAMRIVKEKLRQNYDEEPPDGRVIQQWMNKLFESGSIIDQKRTGRPNERGDYCDAVNDSVITDPKASTRKRSEELGIPRTTMRRLLTKDLGYKPWKSVKVQFLTDQDRLLRVECCHALLEKYANERRSRNLFFSDECAFYGDGNSVNSVFWSKENPYFWEQVCQHPPSVMVWAAMSGEHLIGPFFFDGSINAHSYMEMLRTKFVPALQQLRLLYSCHFQQDGAPAHTAVVTREYLNEVFPDRWVGKFGPITWPARSPDLSSCDNALWGIVKPKVLARKCHTKDELKNVIREEFANFEVSTLQAIHKRTFRRFQICIDQHGKQVDPYDK